MYVGGQKPERVHVSAHVHVSAYGHVGIRGGTHAGGPRPASLGQILTML